MTIADFIEKHDPTFKATRVDSRPNILDWEKANHYLVSITTRRGNITTFYSSGSAIKEKPNVASILECLACDAMTGEMTYREACDEVGEKLDYRMWESCRDTRDNLIDVFGRCGYEELREIEF